ncbi:aminotransferase [Aquamicrobium defluvii]|uniref:L-2,4-diaminobutyrate transaminase n=1 Tax=Aquamicrobium defluvii TaxID=69279 RepID=A0A011V959_9HYPH|nr:aminotransferase [Aquamicrobium defluvii]EXL04930.1 hypothetical protein BG36_09555 [Aquamicrobium defluvii]EZQ14560.1 hypothetical protein CF98_18950 [Halopseudomonas bauzanensis]
MNAGRNFNLHELDKLSLIHPLTSIAEIAAAGPTIYDRASGVHLKDHAGRNLIDMGAGLWCVNIGYGRDELAEVAAKAMRHLSYQHIFGSASSEPAILLADRLLTLFREKATFDQAARVFYGSSGSDANDTAYKLVRYYHNLLGKTRKKKIISRMGAYHGVTYASSSLTGIPSYHKNFDMPEDSVIHISCPNFYTFATSGESVDAFTNRMVAELEAVILREGPDTVGAFIAEPVMGTGGVIVPTPDYFSKIQKLLAQYDILFVVDEVITGFGRTGQWFGTGTYDLKPDIVSLAKGLTSAYFPLSATIISNRIWSVLEEASPATGPFMHGFTYSGHPVGCAIALANLDIMNDEQMVENAAIVGPYLLETLKAATGDNPFVGEIRGVGLMVGVEFIADKDTKRPFRSGSAPHRVVAKRASEHGILTRALPFLTVNSFSPPLCITKSEIDEAVERYALALADSLPELRALAA